MTRTGFWGVAASPEAGTILMRIIAIGNINTLSYIFEAVKEKGREGSEGGVRYQCL